MFLLNLTSEKLLVCSNVDDEIITLPGQLHEHGNPILQINSKIENLVFSFED